MRVVTGESEEALGAGLGVFLSLLPRVTFAAPPAFSMSRLPKSAAAAGFAARKVSKASGPGTTQRPRASISAKPAAAAVRPLAASSIAARCRA